MVEIFSYGGGVQSVAIALLIEQGKLPRPKHIVMADTGRERTSTWEYLHEHIQPRMEAIGLPVEIAPHDLATVDLYSHGGSLLIPAYTTQKLDYVPEAVYDKTSKLRTFCSNQWKVYVIERYLSRTHKLTRSKYNFWLGFSLDEIRRVKTDSNGRNRTPGYRYPLIDIYPVTRNDCTRFILDSGLPLPRKSACWMCPHQTDAEWDELKRNYPDDWQKAVELEREIRERDPHVWLHRSAVPLDQAPLAPKKDAGPSQCSLGICMI